MSNFTDKDKGWNQLMNTFKVNAGDTQGFVGWLRSSGTHAPEKSKVSDKGEIKPPKIGITMAQLARLLEFGSADGNTPEYAYFRKTLAQHSKDIKRLIKKVTASCVSGKMDKKRAVGIICQKIADGLVSTIESNLPPPNSDATIARKGSSHTLIDSAQFKNAVDWEVKSK